MLVSWVLASLSLAIWIFLIVGRGWFWLARPLLPPDNMQALSATPTPSVTAVIPARNEEDVLAQTLPTVLNQTYHGDLRVIVVDDRSEYATASVARHAAARSEHPDRLTVLDGQPLPKRWAGKVWAMNQGVHHARTTGNPEFIWFTDADIAHAPGTLRALVTKAQTDHLDLVSLMAQLRVEKRWDRLLIPAFVYFFAKLYPFRSVANPRRRSAGAAGGCILIRTDALEEARGLQAIQSALIDDCALGRLMKRNGRRLWLGFAREVVSVRVYGTLGSVWDMVARSAFHQLGYSFGRLLGTVLGMTLIYAGPPAAVIAGLVLSVAGISSGCVLALLGGAAWMLMSISFAPILRHQHSSIWLAPLLPVAGFLYTAMTLSSAWRHITGRGGMWKGRPYAGKVDH